MARAAEKRVSQAAGMLIGLWDMQGFLLGPSGTCSCADSQEVFTAGPLTILIWRSPGKVDGDSAVLHPERPRDNRECGPPWSVSRQSPVKQRAGGNFRSK